MTQLNLMPNYLLKERTAGTFTRCMFKWVKNCALCLVHQFSPINMDIWKGVDTWAVHSLVLHQTLCALMCRRREWNSEGVGWKKYHTSRDPYPPVVLWHYKPQCLMTLHPPSMQSCPGCAPFLGAPKYVATAHLLPQFLQLITCF